MGVPGEDDRDWEFAEQFDLPIIRTVKPPAEFAGKAYHGDGSAINSGFLDGLGVSAAKPEVRPLGGLIVGGVIALEALFAGPISGASMNPARSLAPAIMSGSLDHLWIYLTAPFVGALIAVPLCVCVQAPGCCSKEVNP